MSDYPIDPEIHSSSPALLLQGIASYNRMLNVGFYIVQNRLFAFLQDLGRNYDGTFDPSVLADLGPLASSYGAASAHYFG